MEEGVVYARLAGPAAALEVLAGEIFSRWPGTVLSDDGAATVWRGVREFTWAHEAGELVKVALVPGQVPEFTARVRTMAGARAWVGLGGNVGFVSMARGEAMTGGWPWPAMTLQGVGALWPGRRESAEVFRAVKAALDPQGRFPTLED